MKRKEEPKVWVTVLKLIAGATALIGGVGLALWLAAQGSGGSPALEQAIEAAKSAGNSRLVPSSSWGIAGDSPIRPNR
jgi:hypothetical protein